MIIGEVQKGTILSFHGEDVSGLSRLSNLRQLLPQFHVTLLIRYQYERIGAGITSGGPSQQYENPTDVKR